MSPRLDWFCQRSLGSVWWGQGREPACECFHLLMHREDFWKPVICCLARMVLFSQTPQLKHREISHPAFKQNEVSFDSAKCRWILQSKSALSVWCGTVTCLWHNIIWNDIEQHAFGTKLLAGYSFDSSKFIALIPRSFNPLWHKLRLAFVRKLHTLFLYLKLLLTIYAHTSDTHFEWQKEKRSIRIEGKKGQFRLSSVCLFW